MTIVADAPLDELKYGQMLNFADLRGELAKVGLTSPDDAIWLVAKINNIWMGRPYSRPTYYDAYLATRDGCEEQFNSAPATFEISRDESTGLGTDTTRLMVTVYSPSTRIDFEDVLLGTFSIIVVEKDGTCSVNLAQSGTTRILTLIEPPADYTLFDQLPEYVSWNELDIEFLEGLRLHLKHFAKASVLDGYDQFLAWVRVVKGWHPDATLHANIGLSAGVPRLEIRYSYTVSPHVPEQSYATFSQKLTRKA